MTTSEAKKLARAWLVARAYADENNLEYTKITARTVGFQDLARDGKVFVKIHGWNPDSTQSGLWSEFKSFCASHGFCVETDGMFG